MFGYYPVRSSPLPYSYSPYSGNPYTRSSLEAERDRYMRAFTEEQAARDRYAAALARDRELQEAATIRRVQAEALRKRRLREHERNQQGPYYIYTSPYGSRYASSSEECDYPYALSGYDNSAGDSFLDDKDFDVPSDDYEAYKLQDFLRKKELGRLWDEAITKEKARHQKKVEERAAKQAQDWEAVFGHGPSGPGFDFTKTKKEQDESIPRKQRTPSTNPAVSDRSSIPSFRISISEPDRVKSDSAQSQQSANENAYKTKQSESVKSKSRESSPDPINHQVHAARLAALTTIDALRTQFTSLKNVFVFPTSLEFASTPVSSAISETPRLAYTHTNTPVHAYEDALLKLLQALDAVESAGEVDVREKRREMVRTIETELAELDEKKGKVWRSLCEAAAPVVDEKESMEINVGSTKPASITEELVNDVDSKSVVVNDAEMEVVDDTVDTGVEVPSTATHNIDMEVDSRAGSEFQKMDEDTVGLKDDTEAEVSSTLPSIPNEDLRDQQDVEIEDDHATHESDSTSHQLSPELDTYTLPSDSTRTSPTEAHVLAPTSLSEPSSSCPHSPLIYSSTFEDPQVIEESAQATSLDEENDLIVVEEVLSSPVNDNNVEAVQQSSPSLVDSQNLPDGQADSAYPPRAVYPPNGTDEVEHDNFVMVF